VRMIVNYKLEMGNLHAKPLSPLMIRIWGRFNDLTVVDPE